MMAEAYVSIGSMSVGAFSNAMAGHNDSLSLGALLRETLGSGSSYSEGWIFGRRIRDISESTAYFDIIQKVSDSVKTLSDAELVSSLRERSNLTWEQLAKLIGVSRRSVHLWAAGAPVSLVHRDTMEHLKMLLDRYPLPPQQMRAKLFELDASGHSLFDRFCMNRNVGKTDINGPALNPFEML